MPTVSRSELNSDDIVAHFGLVQMRGRTTGAFGTFASQCQGKRKYESKDAASRGARRLKGLVPFRCGFCHAWHNGHRLDR